MSSVSSSPAAGASLAMFADAAYARALSIVLAVFLMGPVAADSGLSIQDPWVRVAPPNSPMAGYMVLVNESDAALSLIGVQAQGFGMAMMHQTVHQDGMASMSHLEQVEIPAGGSVTFEPGGRHLMLMRPQQTYGAGDTIVVSLEFDDGSSREVSFVVANRSEEHTSELQSP